VEGGGLRAISDYAHERGLTFGLWVEIEAAGANSTLQQTHPEWLLTRDGEPIAGGRALDLTQPAVAEFVESEIERLIETYRLDMYRIDHNHSLTPAGNRSYAGFTEDLTWRYYDTFYAIFDRVRARHPALVFQNCAGGGGRLDWGTLWRFHNTELSDWMRMPRGLQILAGVTMSLPPEILLRTFGTEVPEHVLEGDLDTQLRLCFCRVIFRGIAPSLEELTPFLRERITHYLDVYRREIRPLLEGDARVFHHTPFQRLYEPEPWCVLEYASPDGAAAVAALFRTSPLGPDEFLFRPRGLDPAATYAVTADNAGQTVRLSDQELSARGLPVRLETPLTSELLLFRRVEA
jgi:alpha-galactosidase